MPKEETLPTRKKMRKGTHSCFECMSTLLFLGGIATYLLYLYMTRVYTTLMYQSDLCTALPTTVFSPYLW